MCFLDADDTMLPGATAAAVSRFHHDDVARVQWPLLATDRTGRATGLATAERPPEGSLIEEVVRGGPLYDLNYVTYAFHSRAFLRVVMPMPDEPYRHGADVYLLTLAPVYGHLRTLDAPFGTYRVHGANNFRERALDDARLRDYVQRFDINAEHLADHLRRVGRDDVDPDRWRATAFNYLWPTRLLRVRHHLERLVPEGEAFILVDGSEWGDEPVPGRRAIRLVERDGRYWGPPHGAGDAIAAAQQALDCGAQVLALWWTCYWWLDAYPDLMRWVEERARRAVDVEADAALIFQFRDAAEGE